MNIVRFKGKDTKLNSSLKDIVLAMSKKDLNKESIKQAKSLIDTLNKKGIKVQFVIDDDLRKKTSIEESAYVYSGEQFTLLEALNNYLVSQGLPGVLFSELLGIEERFDYEKAVVKRKNLDECWTIDEVKKANSEIDSVVEYIKEMKFSPFEAMMYIHKYASSFRYSETNDMETSRSITGLFNKDKIVCGGYATLVKAIVDKLKMPGLEAETVGCIFVDYDPVMDEFEPNCHSHNLIHIKDDKYGIDGKYMEDATPTKRDLFDLCTFMYPIDDLANYRAKYIQYLDTDAFTTVMQGENHTYAKVLFGELADIPKPPLLEKYKGKYTPVTRDMLEKALRAIGVRDVSEVIKESMKYQKELFSPYSKNCLNPLRCYFKK